MPEGDSDWKDQAYKGAALYGRFKAISNAIVGVIIFSLMIVFSIPFLGKYTKYSKSISAKITGMTTDECDEKIVHSENSSYKLYNCLVNLEYKVGEEVFEKNGILFSSTTKYGTGNHVTIYYDPNNPDDMTPKYQVSPHNVALMCILGGTVGILLTVGYTYLVMNYDSIAAVSGATHGIRDIKRSIF